MKDSIKSPIVLVVDGIIGAGKTTLLEKCLLPKLTEMGYKVTIIKEPVDKWIESGILKNFYSNMPKYSYLFQTVAFSTRIQSCIDAYEKYKDSTDIFILERTTVSDKLFAKMLHEDGLIDEVEYSGYKLWTDLWETLMPFKPDQSIYLRPSLDKCMDRILERSRGAETGITKEYQERLLKKHDEFFVEYIPLSTNNYIPCTTIKTDDDFKSDPITQHNITMQIVDIISKLNKH